jgi:hypothetical protein
VGPFVGIHTTLRRLLLSRTSGGATAYNQWFATPTGVESFQQRANVSVAMSTAWVSNGEFTSSATLSVYQTYAYGIYRLSCQWTVGNHGDKPVLNCDFWE